MGHVALIPIGVEGCLGQRMVLLRPDLTQCDPRFLLYALLSKPVQDQIAWNEGTGSTVSNLRIPVLESLQITVPPLTEQRAIASVLGALDDKIDLNRRTSETLEAMARALFKSWFVDFDPVRAKMEGRQPVGMDAETAALFPDGFEGEVPRGWERVPLVQYCEINPKRVIQRGTVAPYIEMSSLPTNGHRPSAIEHRVVGSGLKFENGDTLLARITPCLENGKSAFIDCLDEGEVASGSTEYIVLRPKSPLPPIWAYLLVRNETFRDFVVQSMTGTTGRQRASGEAVGRYEIIVPVNHATGIGRVFGERVEPLFERIAAADNESRTLAELRDTLLPKLMSGELRVKDAETVMEGVT